MADIGKVRIRIPSSIKRGDVVRVRSLVIHPMEIVQRDKAGKPVDRNYHFINRLIVTYNGREILQADTTQSISENPFFSFTFKPTEPGMLKITFLDTHGGRYEGTAEIKSPEETDFMLRPGTLFGGGIVLAALLSAACAQPEKPSPTAGLPPTPWVSRAVPEAKGEIKSQPDGSRVQVRYKGWATRDFGQYRSYAYDDTRPAPPVGKIPVPAVKGDPKEGRKLFMARAKGPCTGCHLIPGADVWPAGNVGPDLSTYGDRNLPDDFIFALVYDSRNVFPNTTMPPWGTTGVLKPEEIVHLVAFLKTLKGPLPPEKDPNRNPDTRAKPVGFGDNLDPTNNPAILRAEGALALWNKKGPGGKACADCHAGGPEKSMRGAATRWPKYVKAHQRVMSVEDFLAVHAPETTGSQMLAQSDDNLNMTMLVKMQSNGMPVRVDIASAQARAAYERGRASFFKKVGQRNHSCADCHTKGPGHGADKFLGGRLLGDAEAGYTQHFPLWRTSQGAVWDMRKRMQWCMTPLGMNMLPADAVEYAELELFLTAFDNGKEMSVPGIRH